MREISSLGSTADLVEAAQAGDSEAYAALMQRFQQMAYATAYSYLHDHHQAQDIVQEAMIEAFVHLPQLQERVAFPGWFRQIVFRQCTRKLRQPMMPCVSLEAVSDSLFAESDPVDMLVQAERQAWVRAAVAALPQHERLLAVLFYGQRYSYNELSALLNLPLTTVKKRLYSARQRLKERLEASAQDIIEIAREAGAAEAPICMVRWWRQLKQRKEIQQWTMNLIRPLNCVPGLSS